MKKNFQDLVELSNYLRSPEGCPWDREQTLKTLKSFIIEEAYEVIEAIDANDIDELKEELGDLLYQIVFASQICKEGGELNVDDVVDQLYHKLIRRHPHVFGARKAKDSDEALKRWHGEKLKEGSRKRNLLEIPRSMPSLIRAQRVGEKASHVGFDWTGSKDVIKKVEEELRELQVELEKGDSDSIKREWGDLIFSLVNLARHLKFDAETTVHSAIDNFIDRFSNIEEKAKDMNKSLSELSMDQLDALWEKAKGGT